MLTFENVRKAFRGKEVLRGITGCLGEGVYGLLGPNGAGKTTFMRCIVNLYKLQGGKIALDGRDMARDSDVLSCVGYLPQKFGLFRELRVYQMMEYFASLKNIAPAQQARQIQAAVETVNLSDRLTDKVGSLSGGMVRRLGIAQAILGDPRLVILDEPTAGLDPEERMRFKNIVAGIARDRTTLISTHIVEDVEAVCDHIMVMDRGEILASGAVEQIRDRARGKVYVVDGNFSAPDGAFVERKVEGESGAQWRVLSPVPIDGRPAEPTVEDGYMCTVKSI